MIDGPEDKVYVTVDIILALYAGADVDAFAFGIEDDPAEAARLDRLYKELPEDVVNATQKYGAIEHFLANHMEEFQRYCTTIMDEETK